MLHHVIMAFDSLIYWHFIFRLMLIFIWAHHLWNHFWFDMCIVMHLGPYSLSRRPSYRKISWRLEAARFWFRLFQSLWNLTRTLRHNYWRYTCQIFKFQSDTIIVTSTFHSFEALRDFAVRRLTVGVYFPSCEATREINTKITLEWAQKRFVRRGHTLFYFLHDITNP